MVIRKAINMVRDYLTVSDNPLFEAKQLVAFAGDISLNDIILKPDTEIDEEKLMELARRRQSGEPLQYILGTAEFMSLEFDVNENVLIPRSDTETLVEFVINEIGEKKSKVIDIGAGSGCIGISIACYCKNSEVSFVDISEKALKTAQNNTKKHEIEASFYNMDILKEYPEGKYDVIVSNPPYIRTDVIPTLMREVREHEPVTALDGGEDGLVFYRRITDISEEMLKPCGTLVFEIGYDQGEEVLALVKDRFCETGILKDLTGNDRVVFAKCPKIMR